jgi:hypothetical protein
MRRIVHSGANATTLRVAVPDDKTIDRRRTDVAGDNDSFPQASSVHDRGKLFRIPRSKFVIRFRSLKSTIQVDSGSQFDRFAIHPTRHPDLVPRHGDTERVSNRVERSGPRFPVGTVAGFGYVESARKHPGDWEERQA